MAEVWVPPRMQALAGGQKTVRIPGRSIRQLINNLEKEYPGMKDCLIDEEGIDILPGIAVIVDGETSQLGLLERIEEDCEVHFIPALGGG